MSKTLERAFAELKTLSESDQELIGQRLLSQVGRLRRLRAELDKGIRSVDVGQGRELHSVKFLAKARELHAADRANPIQRSRALAQRRISFNCLP